MKQTPLLQYELAPQKRAALASLLQQPGWAVVEELHMDACRRATEDVLKQNPADPGYNDKTVIALQQRARERNEFSLLILGSVEYHAKALAVQQQEETEKPQENPIVKGLNKK